MNEFYIQTDPDGGDLGRAAVRIIEPLEFSVVIPHVAYILEELYKLNNSRFPYHYAFEFNASARKAVEIVMMGARLPEHVEWYRSDGLDLFSLRGASGGVVTTIICYLITKTR